MSIEHRRGMPGNISISATSLKSSPASQTVIASLIDGLNNVNTSIDSRNTLVALYKKHIGSRIQDDILAQLLEAENSPALTDTVRELLLDKTKGSLSRSFDEQDRKDILAIVKANVEDRPQMLLEHISQASLPFSDNQHPQPANPTEIPIDGMSLREVYLELRRRKESGADSRVDPNLMERLKSLTQKNNAEFLQELSRQLHEDSDFGRHIGKFMHDDKQFRDQMTKAMLQIIKYEPPNPSVLSNVISYTHQIGSNRVIPFMDSEQRISLLPHLLRQEDQDRLAFASNDLLNRLKEGETTTLNTLANHGPIAIPVLWRVFIALRSDQQKESL